jgi:hypothetical protein
LLKQSALALLFQFMLHIRNLKLQLMRKIYFLTIALVCFSFLSNAQIRKGSFYLGGDIGYSSQKEERINPAGGMNNEGEQKSISFSPSIGMAVKENVFAGIDFTYANNESENLSSSNNYKTKALGAGIFLRRYFPVANRFYLFGQVRLGYLDRESDMTSTFNADRTQEDSWSLQAGLFPGLSYNIYKSLYLEMGLNNLLQIGYENIDRTETRTFGGTFSTERKSFFLQSSLANSGLNIGVRFILPKN